jgi:hypothetical protein
VIAGAATAKSPLLIAQGVIVLGLLLLWLGQPFLPGWGCAASMPGICPPHVLPVRASLISAVILAALLLLLLLVAALPNLTPRKVRGFSRFAFIAVPTVLILTVLAHFLIPQP